MRLVDIETNTNLSNKTIGEIVTELVEWGLADKPPNSRKGVAITEKGVVLLDSMR